MSTPDNTKQILTTLQASQQGNLDELKRLHEAGCPWDWYSKPTAAARGDLEMLKYIHENGFEIFPPFTTSWAAREGKLDCLMYARERGCPWRSVSIELAAMNGHTNVVKYMFENGCPWESSITAVASREGRLETLKYLVEEAKISLHPYAKVWAKNDEIKEYINIKEGNNKE